MTTSPRERTQMGRIPDEVIGGLENPYLLRWYLIPRNRWFNVYLHRFLRSDDDRALHDHPWVNCSIVLAGEYREHLPAGRWKRRRPGAIVFRRAIAGTVFYFLVDSDAQKVA